MRDAATPDERRTRLASLTDDRGVVIGLAIDHRDSLRALASGPAGMLDDDTLRDLKRRIVAAVAPAASAVMLDEELGGSALDAGAVPESVGLIMPLEAQGYEAVGDGRATRLLEAFGPPDAVARGAAACKVLLPYRADDASGLAQRALVATAAARTHAAGLPLVVEPIPFRRAGEDEDAFAHAWPDLVAAAVADLGAFGVDLWKLPFPALTGEPGTAAGACETLDIACRGTPWVLLGAGVALEAFVGQIEVAGRAGACGFLAGRGIWGPAVAAATHGASGTELDRILADDVRPAFEACRTAAVASCRPLAARPG